MLKVRFCDRVYDFYEKVWFLSLDIRTMYNVKCHQYSLKFNFDMQIASILNTFFLHMAITLATVNQPKIYNHVNILRAAIP